MVGATSTSDVAWSWIVVGQRRAAWREAARAMIDVPEAVRILRVGGARGHVRKDDGATGVPGAFSQGRRPQ